MKKLEYTRAVLRVEQLVKKTIVNRTRGPPQRTNANGPTNGASSNLHLALNNAWDSPKISIQYENI